MSPFHPYTSVRHRPQQTHNNKILNNLGLFFNFIHYENMVADNTSKQQGSITVTQHEREYNIIQPR